MRDEGKDAKGADVKVVDRRWWAREASGDPEAAAPSLKPSYVEELERQLAEKDRLIQEAVSRHREAAKEYEEARVRLRREIGRDLERTRRAVLAEMLDVLDNLDRSIDAARASAANQDALLQGVAMVRDQFLSKLEGFGVRRLSGAGQPFDPVTQEALSVVPATDPDQDGLVAAVITPGYAIGEEILRPARVVVSKVTISPESGSA
jgi:molecular chaperone GrpE